MSVNGCTIWNSVLLLIQTNFYEHGEGSQQPGESIQQMPSEMLELHSKVEAPPLQNEYRIGIVTSLKRN